MASNDYEIWLRAEVDRLRAALADARRRIAAAAALHPRYICEEGEFCGTCSLDDVPEDWPCPTVRALSAGGADRTEGGGDE